MKYSLSLLCLAGSSTTFAQSMNAQAAMSAPELSTVSLLIAGLVALGLARRGTTK